MKKTDLLAAVQTVKEETRVALQTMYDALNQGQRKKLAGNPAVRELLERYGVEIEEEQHD